MKKVLVTGSLGQLGSFLCEDLLKDGVDCIGLDNEMNSCNKFSTAVDKITVRGDTRDSEMVRKVCKDVDAIVHCAAQISVESSFKDPVFDVENNVIGTLNLLKSAIEKDVFRRFVYISSAAVYGNPIKLPISEDHPRNPQSPYGLNKFFSEEYVGFFNTHYGLPTVIIRPFNIYSKRADPKSPYSGVITKFVDRVKENKSPVIEGDGKQTRDFIHADDTVQIIRLALEKDKAVGETFNCGSGKSTTIKEIADKIISISGKNMKVIFKDKRKGDIKHSYADINKAKRLLDFKPEIELIDEIEELTK